MILALDVGNTNIVLGCLEDGKIIFSGRLTTDSKKTDFEFAAMLKGILSLNHIDAMGFEGAIISSVVPQVNKPLKKAIKLVTGKEAYTVTGCEDLKAELDEPNQLGNDIVVGGIAALNKFKPPMALIDMGTATTIFIIGENSAYIGGVIMPGVMVSQRALTEHTSLLPSISFEAPQKVIAKNTVDAMKSGAVFGSASMIDGMLYKIEEEFGKPLTAVATGGLAEYIIPHCKHKIIYEENLILDGLRLIYKKRFPKKMIK